MLARANACPGIGLHGPLSRGLDSSLGSPSARGSMDRAPDYGSGGWGFKSLRARQIDRHIQFPLSGFSSRARTSLARSIRVVLAASIRPFAHRVRAGVRTVFARGVVAVTPAGFGAPQIVIKALDVKLSCTAPPPLDGLADLTGVLGHMAAVTCPLAASQGVLGHMAPR